MIPLDPVPHPIDHLPGRGAPGDVAIADRMGEMTYAELEQAVGSLAGWMLGSWLMSIQEILCRLDQDQKMYETISK